MGAGRSGPPEPSGKERENLQKIHNLPGDTSGAGPVPWGKGENYRNMRGEKGKSPLSFLKELPIDLFCYS